MPVTYRRRPGQILAVKWDGTEHSQGLLLEFAGKDRVSFGRTPSGRLSLELVAGKNGAQGWVFVPVGHWVVRTPDDAEDYWPIEGAYFQRNYEPVD